MHFVLVTLLFLWIAQVPDTESDTAAESPKLVVLSRHRVTDSQGSMLYAPFASALRDLSEVSEHYIQLGDDGLTTGRIGFVNDRYMVSLEEYMDSLDRRVSLRAQGERSQEAGIRLRLEWLRGDELLRTELVPLTEVGATVTRVLAFDPRMGYLHTITYELTTRERFRNSQRDKF